MMGHAGCSLVSTEGEVKYDISPHFSTTFRDNDCHAALFVLKEIKFAPELPLTSSEKSRLVTG